MKELTEAEKAEVLRLYKVNPWVRRIAEFEHSAANRLLVLQFVRLAQTWDFLSRNAPDLLPLVPRPGLLGRESIVTSDGRELDAHSCAAELLKLAAALRSRAEEITQKR